MKYNIISEEMVLRFWWVETGGSSLVMSAWSIEYNLKKKRVYIVELDIRDGPVGMSHYSLFAWCLHVRGYLDTGLSLVVSTLFF
jgi:hypothetical protein